MNLTEIFIVVVEKAEHLPAIVRVNALAASGVADSFFDESYIEFLDGMIERSPRGSEWTERLKKRRAALLAFCRQPLIHGYINVEDKRYSVYVDLKNETVIHWEEY